MAVFGGCPDFRCSVEIAFTCDLDGVWNAQHGKNPEQSRRFAEFTNPWGRSTLGLVADFPLFGAWLAEVHAYEMAEVRS